MKTWFKPEEITHYCQLLDRDGYVIVPNVLTPEEVRSARHFFLEKFKNPEKHFEGNDYVEAMFEIYERFEELSGLLFKEPAISIVRQLLGENFVLLKDSSVNYNRYGWWWHKDTSNEERRGYTYHLEPQFRRLMVTYYLQDNHKIYGGGLDVEPGTHLLPDPGFEYPTWSEEKDPLWRRILGKPKKEKKKLPNYNDHMVKKPFTIPNKAGDLVIFDVKINHRATQKKVDVVPLEHEKIAIFTHFSRNNNIVEQNKSYFDNIFQKPTIKRDYSQKIKEEAAKIGMSLL
jgi:hypothetical protein